MAVKMRKAKSKNGQCNSCMSNARLYEIGIGPEGGNKLIITLCSTCMYKLLRKLVIIGRENDEVC